ncbi:diguanylate cyclase (GGDEF)-like protein/PAS domain S-box-containing protein [Paenibacillus shirakamiensis]|uniref:Diguanylate cyclase (GGDEF)-like protein/PAS domain S-box-containing protein n=1 Tax=Paenibacillus shirakamiensis TaxID=1265935 RepID=A0ABS4JLU8_9BACL|nr:GGDEF domain-containing phosphodiesterase [Paenibacillus shirakamiensis]MBP2001554.1 diguanylate cyclase (GGDEF)-like protein/PAS domain S-box-containing protein [Paenibacillus shirakamiensis]
MNWVVGSFIFICVGLLGFLWTSYRLYQYKRRLHDSEERYHTASYGSDIIIWNMDIAKEKYYISDPWYALMGYVRGEFKGQLQSWRSLIHPEDRLSAEVARAAHMTGNQAIYRAEYRMRKKDGEYLWFEVRGKAIRDKYGTPLRMAGSIMDITASREKAVLLQLSHDEMKRKEEYHNLVLGVSNDGVWELNIEDRRIYLSPRLQDMLGYESLHYIDTDSLTKYIHPDDEEAIRTAAQQYFTNSSEYFQCEYRMRKAGGKYTWFLARGRGIFDENGKATRMAGSNTDIDELKKVQEQLQLLAYNDTLSGLPNRLYMLEELDRFFRQPEGGIAVFFIDMDNFKFINDTLGHKSGDQLIRLVSQRLSTYLPHEGMLFRWGGDEFVYLLKMTSCDNAKNIAEHIIRQFKQPILLNENQLHVSVSIGIATYPEDGNSAEELLKNADLAMYRSKRAGKGIYTLYDRSMHEDLTQRMLMDKHLRTALDQDEFSLYYQPQLSFETGQIVGFEALLRWSSPELGNVPPNLFVPVAEDNRLIISIGEWVMITACAFMKDLHNKGYTECRISVNISVIQMAQDDFISTVLDILEDTGLAPSFLELEITESIFMDSYEIIIYKLEILRSLGVRIALDDFGTGYSSLSYLKQLPISTLKIDKSFIDNLPDESKNRSLTEAIIVMGHKLGLEIVAEGVESYKQLAFLKESGCDHIQGYFLSRPVEESQVPVLMEKY